MEQELIKVFMKMHRFRQVTHNSIPDPNFIPRPFLLGMYFENSKPFSQFGDHFFGPVEINKKRDVYFPELLAEVHQCFPQELSPEGFGPQEAICITIKVTRVKAVHRYYLFSLAGLGKGEVVFNPKVISEPMQEGLHSLT